MDDRLEELLSDIRALLVDIRNMCAAALEHAVDESMVEEASELNRNRES